MVLDMDYILKGALLHKVSDIGLWGSGIIKHETLLEFIRQLSTPTMGRYIQNLSNMYVLVGSYDSQSRLKPNEKPWNEILTADEYLFIEGNSEIILGFMLMDNTKTAYHTIDYIWIRDSLRCKGLARRLILKYEMLVNTDKSINVIPGEVASPFWKGYFTEIFGIYTLKDLEAFKDRVGVHVQWDLLEARYRHSDVSKFDSETESECEAEYKILPV